MSDQIFVAKESFATRLDGNDVVVTKGQTRVRAGHKLMKGREAFFEPLKVHYEVESATSAPGEKRQSTPAPTAQPAASAKAGDTAKAADKSKEDK